MTVRLDDPQASAVRVAPGDLDAFLRAMSPQVPVHLVGVLQASPLLQLTADRLRTQYGSQLVRVHITAPDLKPQSLFDAEETARSQRESPLRVVSMQLSSAVSAIFDREETSALHAVAGQPLSFLEPALAAQLAPPAFSLLLDRPAPYLWIGPAGKIVPLHRDGVPGFLAQIEGRKQLTLVVECDDSIVYPHPQNRALSQIADADRPSLARFPSFAKARRLRCMLEPGDLLFLPRGVWHQVRYVEDGVSVNFWPRAYLEAEGPHTLAPEGVRPDRSPA